MASQRLDEPMDNDNEYEDSSDRGERDSMQRFRERSETDLDQQSARRFAGAGAVFRDQLDRLWTMSRMEQGLLVTGLGIAAVGLLLVFSDIGRGSSSEAGPPLQVQASAEEPREDTAAVVSPTEQPVLASVAVEPDTVDESQLPLPANVPNRANCQQINGTSYLSAEERSWYLANCEQPADPVQVVIVEPTAVPSEQPTARPVATVGEGFSASDAISFGIRAIGGQTDAGSCTASQINSIWLVSCQESGSLSTVCVREPSGAILPSEEC